MIYNAFLYLLDVKRSEVSDLLLMLGHALFSGLAIAFSFTAINLLLIEFHGIEILPYIYLLGGTFLLLGGKAYAYFEHVLTPTKLFHSVLILSALWAVSSPGLAYYSETQWLLGFLYALYFLIYQLNKLEFWGILALTYDIRQSKRLFGIINSGDDLAKIIGYLLSPLIVTTFSTSILFNFAAGAFMFSLIVLWMITERKKKSLSFAKHYDYKELTAKHSPVSFSKKKFIKFAGYFSLITIMIAYLIHYSFLDQVQTRFDDLESVAVFFGFFFAIAKFLNLFIKAFSYNKLVNHLGLNLVILILPIILGLSILIGIISFILTPQPLELMAWVFVICMLINEIIRSSIHDPAFLTLFQPLDKANRLQGHTVVKGYMEPAGIALTGLVMLSFIWMNIFSMQIMLFSLFAMIILWIMFGVNLSKLYTGLLRFVLKNRLLKINDLKFSKNDKKIFEEKLINGDEFEKLFALQILDGAISYEHKNKTISELLTNVSPEVIQEAIKSISEKNIEVFLPELRKLIEHKDIEVCRKAAFLYCRSLDDKAIDEISTLIDIYSKEHSFGNRARMEILIAAVMKYSGLQGAILYGQKLLYWANSDQLNDRVSAAHITGLIGAENFYHPLVKLLNDPEKQVKNAAFKAAITTKSEKLLPLLFEYAINTRFYRQAKLAILSQPEKALPVISNMLNNNLDRRTTFRLIKICSSMEGIHAQTLLIQNLSNNDFFVRQECINALYRRGFKVFAHNENNIVEAEMSHELKTFRGLCGLLTLMDDSAFNLHIKNAVFEEIKLLEMRIMKFCAFLYDKKIIQHAIDNIKLSELGSDYRSNAIEMIDVNLKNKHAKPLIEVLEFDPDVFIRIKKNILIQQLTELTLSFLDNHFTKCVSDWLTGLIIRWCSFNNVELNKQLIENLSKIGSLVVNEELKINKSKLYTHGLSN